MSQKRLLTNCNAFKRTDSRCHSVVSSKRDIPLNNTAIEMIKDLHQERYLGENTPLVCDENGNNTRPVNFRKRYYRILKAAGIEIKGLHSLRRP